MSMKAVVFRGAFDVAVEQRPKPQIINATDAIVHVKYAGICGSELHMYRGYQETKTGHIMGHEFIGTVEQIGDAVSRFSPGDLVVSIFSPVCMKCWFCTRGLTNRCIHGTAFGTQLLNGGQAEYVRVPFADGTLYHAPNGMDHRLLIMMCDIFPTGYYGACRAIEGLHTQYESRLTSFQHQIPKSGENGISLSSFLSSNTNSMLSNSVIVCLGCGPVGICAIATARFKGIKTIFAVDSVEDRLKEAEQIGAIPLLLSRDDINKRVMEATAGRGADAVIEVVGNKAALASAFQLLRPCGVLSSIGFHQSELPFTALECYQKNLNVNFGRVPVRTVFEDALECLRANEQNLKSSVTHELNLQDAAHGYRIFEQHKARKVILQI
ncbi:chaperonin 10-like protein [Xylogone sp. PMI_703]|nr:chaperonin 10-like protein [Xylogone sp. PMI_703]